MNNMKRKELDRAIETIQSAKTIIESVMDDEQTAFDNLSEGLQQTMRGSQMEEAINNMAEAIEECDIVIDFLQEAEY